MVDLNTVKQYLRIDGDGDDLLLNMCIESAVEFVKQFTGLTEDEIDTKKSLNLAIIAIIADMYELRQATVSGIQLNPLVEYALNMHQRNLL